MTTERRHDGAFLAAAVAAMIFAGAPGCGTTRPTAPASPPPAVDLLADEAEPFIRGGDSGLEAHTWIVSEDVDRIGEALAPFAENNVPLDPELRERWRAHGLRIVRVPVGEVAALRRALPIVGRVDRRWLGQAPAWAELFRGAGFALTQAFQVGEEAVRLPPGRLRLIVRAWTAPGETGPVVRTELGVQHVARAGAVEEAEIFAPPRLRGAADEEGLVLSTLSVRLALSGGDAYVIAYEEPAIEWGGSDGRDDGDEGAAPSPGAEALTQGPPMPRAALVGAALLTRRGVGREPGVRVLIVLTPRTPERLRLLP